MKFKVDENLPIDVTDVLAGAGYDAVTVMQQGLSGSSDYNLAVICQDEGRVMLTLDMDFGDIRSYPPDEYVGIIVLRLLRQDKPHVLAVVKRLMPLMKTEPLTGHLWMVDEDKVRVR